MARLIELHDRRWTRAVLDTDEMLYRKHDRLMAEYLRKSTLATENNLTGFVYKYPLYDGFAYYVVTCHHPLKMAWINYYNGHRVRRDIIAELTVDDLVSLMKIEKKNTKIKMGLDKILENIKL